MFRVSRHFRRKLLPKLHITTVNLGYNEFQIPRGDFVKNRYLLHPNDNECPQKFLPNLDESGIKSNSLFYIQNNTFHAGSSLEPSIRCIRIRYNQGSLTLVAVQSTLVFGTIHIVPISDFGHIIFIRKECAISEAVLIQRLRKQCFPATQAGINVYSVSAYNKRDIHGTGSADIVDQSKTAVAKPSYSKQLWNHAEKHNGNAPGT